MLDKIKGAIFDMDGTLVNSLFFWDILWKRIGNDFLGGKPFRPTDEEDKNMLKRNCISIDYSFDFYSSAIHRTSI